MSLFRAPKEDKSYEEDLPEEDEVLESLDKLILALREQTKLIKELSIEVKELRQECIDLNIKVQNNLNKDEELRDVKSKLFEMMNWIQCQFVSMLSHTKEKAEDTKVSPAVKAYLSRKDASKLPLPG